MGELGVTVLGQVLLEIAHELVGHRTHTPGDLLTGHQDVIDLGKHDLMDSSRKLFQL